MPKFTRIVLVVAPSPDARHYYPLPVRTRKLKRFIDALKFTLAYPWKEHKDTYTLQTCDMECTRGDLGKVLAMAKDVRPFVQRMLARTVSKRLHKSTRIDSLPVLYQDPVMRGVKEDDKTVLWVHIHLDAY